jgi:tetratricopeptide (TPR) repeat protein
MSQATLDQAAQLRRDHKHEQARVLLAQAAARLQPELERLANNASAESMALRTLAANVHYDLACTHDYLGEEPQAWPHYQVAIKLGLTEAQLRGALLGAGSTARNIQKLHDSEALLRRGLDQYGVDSEFAPFLALTLHSQGKHNEALALALHCISKTSSNSNITQFNRALAEYAQLLCSPSSSVE